MVEAAMERGLDGMIITDHNTLLSPSCQKKINKKHPDFKVFMGAEVSIGNEHVLVIGGNYFDIHAYSPDNISEFKKAVLDSGAFTALAHPWWQHDKDLAFDLNVYHPDAIDVLSMNVDTSRLKESLQIADQYDMHIIAGSDAHSAKEVGLFYIDVDQDVSTNEELVSELRKGNYSIGADPLLFSERLDEVKTQEAIADAVIAKDGTLDDFFAAGGAHKAFYQRRCAGGSYFPEHSLIGTRANRT